MTSGFSKMLSKDKKKPWPTLPLTIGSYTVKDLKEVEVEADHIRGFHFVSLDLWSYDQERIVPAHCKRPNFNWTYQHTEAVTEDEVRNWYNALRVAALEEEFELDGNQGDQS